MIDKIGNAAAAGAYSNIAKIGAGAPSSGQPSFGDFMKDGITGVIDGLKAGETMAGKAVTGQANTIDVVQAMNAADLGLKTLVAIRDKMVGAYTEIMRMQI